MSKKIARAPGVRKRYKPIKLGVGGGGGAKQNRSEIIKSYKEFTYKAYLRLWQLV